jgi:hypothetical protein
MLLMGILSKTLVFRLYTMLFPALGISISEQLGCLFIQQNPNGVYTNSRSNGHINQIKDSDYQHQNPCPASAL